MPVRSVTAKKEQTIGFGHVLAGACYTEINATARPRQGVNTKAITSKAGTCTTTFTTPKTVALDYEATQTNETKRNQTIHKQTELLDISQCPKYSKDNANQLDCQQSPRTPHAQDNCEPQTIACQPHRRHT